jgi:DNA-binding response OmpR family regulator
MRIPEKSLPGKVFILEDDFDYADLISREFSALGFEVEVCHSLSQAKKLLSDKKYDLYIIDRLLPDGDGITLVKELKEADPRLLIIMISVRKEEADRVLGLSLGADDYLPKPFNPRELVLRAEKLLGAKNYLSPQRFLVVGDFVLDTKGKEIYFQGRRLKLTPYEFKIMELFLKKPGEIIPKADLVKLLTGEEKKSRSIDVLIRRLREKIGDSARKPRYIKTIWGEGYRFEPR